MEAKIGWLCRYRLHGKQIVITLSINSCNVLKTHCVETFWDYLKSFDVHEFSNLLVNRIKISFLQNSHYKVCHTVFCKGEGFWYYNIEKVLPGQSWGLWWCCCFRYGEKIDIWFVAETNFHVSIIIQLLLIACENQVEWLFVCKFRPAIQRLRKCNVIVQYVYSLLVYSLFE